MMKRIQFTLIFVLLIGIFSINSLANGSETIFYVAKDGNDSWTGKLLSPNSERTDGPFVTLEKARDAIRSLKSGGVLPGPVKVMVRGGTYYLDKTFVLEAQDSGSEQSPITYMAYPGESVTISGGKRIKADWKVYNGKIMVCTVPEAKNGSWYFRQLFVNSKRQIRSRIPNNDYFHIADTVKIEKNQNSAFKYKAGDIKRWSNLNDVEVLYFYSWDEAILRIMDIDESANTVTFTGFCPRKFDPKNFSGYERYYVENVLEGLDSPGEWYLNKQTGELYYWPLEKENIQDSEIIAPVLTELIRVQGNSEKEELIRSVKIAGFSLCDADWSLPQTGYIGRQASVGIGQPEMSAWRENTQTTSAIVFNGVENCTLENNIIVNVGTYAVRFGDHCQYNTIAGNEIKDIGAGGILIGTMDGKNYSTKRNTIYNNHIHDCGSVFNGGVGIWIGHSAENTISHNEIHDITYSGMSVGWSWGFEDNPCYGNIIEFNKVYRVVKNANDGGGIYTLGKQPGTVIRNNIFHDIYPAHHFAWGIYLDGHTSNVTVMNNVIYRCEYGNLMINPGKHNLWINNILVNSGKGQLYWGMEDEPAYNRFIQNIVYYSGTDSYLIDANGRGILKKMGEMDYNVYYYTRSMDPKNMKIKSYWGRVIQDAESFFEWQKWGFDFHSIITDPLFVDAEHDNYMLKPESPAFKLGFKQIDVSKVGLVKEKD